MSGETELSTLIKGMKPQLQPGEYVFCTVPVDRVPTNIEPVCVFREAEGTTLIITKQQADKLSIPYSFVAAWITLTIHSSLEAVGLTAAISHKLAIAGISCNLVAAYYHDHLFVRCQDAQRTMEILTLMSKDETQKI
ncbi:ACT domain-containing protein [Desmonostoc muscorum LEGE 12446]|uniref:ACT domain-containing protein n=1 Tax=Desmonostoc muscorum LEGE 12446 TaxID=1828758 RepID=A0A8J7CZI8_DESMC|nr:ACT domain-containing protein [Desmonostoc muscorum]MCF2145169.1 ACT domain-containing protein [Desmonostoc muscorum LEGE 12446]